jgi:DNA-binding XRE family transcriptional regulator
MEKKECSRVRLRLGKTQVEMARLLGVSLKAVQSFEQGWRKIPAHVERQALFLAAVKAWPPDKAKPCWNARKCSAETKRNCPAWEFRVGNLCWFINGTVCHGEIQDSWRKKMTICRRCAVFRAIFGSSIAEPTTARGHSQPRNSKSSLGRGTSPAAGEARKRPAREGAGGT